MNYRHAYHAGNFADVMKHAVLVRVILALQRKDTAIRVLDTHAGRGLYHLDGNEATRAGEWPDGIGRLIGRDSAPIGGRAADLLAPYLKLVALFNPEHGPDARLTRYPGSPLIARQMLRPQDRLVVAELHPEDGETLADTFAGDSQVRVISGDGWHAVKSQLPPLERRGVVLIDPPFERPGEFDRLAEALHEGIRRFATGVFLLWYPIKDPRLVARFHRSLVDSGLTRLMKAEVLLRQITDRDLQAPQLAGAGLVILNPPFGLDDELKPMLSALAVAFARGEGARASVVNLVGETSRAAGGGTAT